jgi:hypothetical protein
MHCRLLCSRRFSRRGSVCYTSIEKWAGSCWGGTDPAFSAAHFLLEQRASGTRADLSVTPLPEV